MGIFGNAFGWPHLLIILAVLLLIFGATRLPALAKGVGQSLRVFKKEMKADDAETEEGKAESTSAPSSDEPAKK